MHISRREFGWILPVAAGAGVLVNHMLIPSVLSQQTSDRLVIDVEEGPDGYIFGAMRDLTVDSEGNIYVLEFLDCMVSKFSPEGNFLFKFGRKGGGPGEFQMPIEIETDGSEALYVYDSRRKQIIKFDLEGNYTDKYLRVGDFTITVSNFEILTDNKVLINGFSSSNFNNLDDIQIFHMADFETGDIESFGKIYQYSGVDRIFRDIEPSMSPYLLGGACAVYESSIFFINRYHPRDLIVYEIGEDIPHLISEDETLTGGIRISKRESGDNRDTQMMGKTGDMLSLWADQKIGEEIFLVNEAVYMLIRDRAANLSFVRGYSIVDGHVVFTKNYDFDVVNHLEPVLDHVDSNLNAYFKWTSDPFPCVIRESLR